MKQALAGFVSVVRARVVARFEAGAGPLVPEQYRRQALLGVDRPYRLCRIKSDGVRKFQELDHIHPSLPALDVCEIGAVDIQELGKLDLSETGFLAFSDEELAKRLMSGGSQGARHCASGGGTPLTRPFRLFKNSNIRSILN